MVLCCSEVSDDYLLLQVAIWSITSEPAFKRQCDVV
jgi:hypothetical protein